MASSFFPSEVIVADLSGGEQGMLAIARALIRDTRTILPDKPFEGLAPIIIHDSLIVARQLADDRCTIIVVEQNVAAALSIAQRRYIINNGHTVHEGTPAELREQTPIMHEYLGV